MSPRTGRVALGAAAGFFCAGMVLGGLAPGCEPGSLSFSLYSVLPSSVTPSGTSVPGALALSTTVTRTGSSGVSAASSTRLLVSWSAATGPVDHYRIQATDGVTGAVSEFTAPSGGTELTLTGLKSATSYSVAVDSCADAACATTTSVGTGTEVTPGEVWELQGTGGSFSGLSSLVSDGNARLSLLWFGNDTTAGSMAGKINLYYGPTGGTSLAGLAVATMAGVSSTGDIASVSSFTSHAGSAGLVQVSGDPKVQEINAGQAVALGTTSGGNMLIGKVRLFFEAIGSDGLSRIYSVDSQDGYTGLDFHGGAGKTVCNSATDYSNPSYCQPVRAIGTETDDPSAFPHVLNARQMKLGWPTLTDWKWNGDAGNFMVFTVDVPSACSTSKMPDAYALYDGVSQWVVQYDNAGGTHCPQLFEDVQTPSPMHLGGVKYKMYYGNPTQTTGITPGSPLPFPGPKRVFYAEGALTGESDKVEFDDWERVADSRELTFVWPDGTTLTPHEEGYIDDFQFVTPTGDLDFQVAYLTIAEPNLGAGGIPKDAIALLLNP